MTAVTQDAFRAGLLDGATAAPPGLRDGAGRAAGRRYDVYRNNVAVSLRAALESGFPAVARLLGPENFAMAAGRYLRQAPPGSPVMLDYGAGFPAFLAAQEALARWGYLADVARLELALRESYHAADSAPLDPAALQGLSEEALAGARVWLAPSLRLVRSAWPVLSIRRYALQPGAPKPAAEAEDVVVLRPTFDPAPHALPPRGADFLAALVQGRPFAKALEAAGDGFDLAATLSLLLEGGGLTHLETGENP